MYFIPYVGKTIHDEEDKQALLVAQSMPSTAHHTAPSTKLAHTPSCLDKNAVTGSKLMTGTVWTSDSISRILKNTDRGCKW